MCSYHGRILANLNRRNTDDEHPRAPFECNAKSLLAALQIVYKNPALKFELFFTLLELFA